MTTTCMHLVTTDIEGDTWHDSNGKLHTVIKSKCANPFCVRYGQVVRIRQTGDDVPQVYMPPPFKGVKP